MALVEHAFIVALDHLAPFQNRHHFWFDSLFIDLFYYLVFSRASFCMCRLDYDVTRNRLWKIEYPDWLLVKGVIRLIQQSLVVKLLIVTKHYS